MARRKKSSLWKTITETAHHLFHPKRSNNHRPKVLHHTSYLYFIGLVLLSAVLLRAWQATPQNLSSVLGFSSTITASQVVEQTNQKRATQGLEPLTVNSSLNQAALAKAQDMMSDQYWAHVAPDGTQPWFFISQAGYTYTVAGENLARDFSDTPSMVAAWMASPTHKANILHPRYKEIGIAVVDGELLGYETTLVVQMFGSQAGGRLSDGNVPSSGQVAAVVQEAEPTPSEDEESISEATLVENSSTNNQQASNPEENQEILGGILVPVTELKVPPLFSPLQLSKAVFLALLMVIVTTLIYDAVVIGHRRTARLVGKNLAHLLFLSAIAFLIIFFKGGLIS